MPLFQQLTAIAPLFAGVACCWFLARPGKPGRAARIWAAVLLVTALVWSQVQKEYEGPTVVPITPSRGLTIADLVLVPSFAIACAVFARARRR